MPTPLCQRGTVRLRGDRAPKTAVPNGRLAHQVDVRVGASDTDRMANSGT